MHRHGAGRGHRAGARELTAQKSRSLLGSAGRISRTTAWWIAAGVTFILLLWGSAKRLPPVQPALIEVDFSSPAPTRSYSGFLHGLTPALPADELLAPLQIQHWRTAVHRLAGLTIEPVSYARMRRVAPAVQVQYLLSDAWGYDCCRERIVWPYEDWVGWEKRVADVVKAVADAEQSISYWEVWNEPDIDFFWAGTDEQHFEAYARAYRVLRDLLGPTIPIAGPGYARYDTELIERFLDFCLMNRLEVNVLSWHHNESVPSPGLFVEIQDARKRFQLNPKYAPLRIQRIHIDEYSGPFANYSPGALLGHLFYLEAAQPDAAAKACWRDRKYVNECFNGSLDGLIDVESQAPRSTWWVYKLYADGVATRVRSSTDNPGTVALASGFPSTYRTQVLVARFSSEKKPRAQLVDLQLRDISCPAVSPQGAQQVALTIGRLKPGSEPASGPRTELQMVVPCEKQLAIQIPRFEANDVYVVDMAPAKNGAYAQPSAWSIAPAR